MVRPSRPEATLCRALAAALRRAADPARAPAMQAYMKSALPFLGVSSPVRQALVRDVLAAHPLPSAAALFAAVETLWDVARFREQRYVALDLLLHPEHAAWLELDALPLVERLIVEGAWWDYVDALAAHALGPILRRHPARMKRTLLGWAKGRDIWKRRAAILAQLSYREDTDVELLYACIEPSIGRSEFFLRKAIGWALRQLAWTDPDEVVRYVRRNRARLSPLSQREALKNVNRAGAASKRASGRAGARRAVR